MKKRTIKITFKKNKKIKVDMKKIKRQDIKDAILMLDWHLNNEPKLKG